MGFMAKFIGMSFDDDDSSSEGFQQADEADAFQIFDPIFHVRLLFCLKLLISSVE